MRPTEEWLEFLLTESERYQNIILDLPLNDASGLGGAMGRMIRRGRGDRPDGVLLTGPSGAGKHNVAWHILQALDEEDCAPVFLTGEELAEFKGDFPALAERLNALMEQFYERKQDLCLVVEEPERGGLGKQLYSFLGRTVRTYRTYSAEDPSLFLILIAGKQPPMPSLLRDQLLLCPCELPDEARRAAYLEDRGKTIRRYVSLKRLAELTEGCSYAALGQIVDLLGFGIDATDRVPDEQAVLRCVRQVTAGEQTRKQDPVAEALQRLETVFVGLRDALSGLELSRRGTKPEAEPEPEPVVEQSVSFAPELDQKKFEEMRINQISLDVFNGERLQSLLENGQ